MRVVMDARDTSDSLLPRDLTPGSCCPFPGFALPVKVRLTVLPDHPCSYLPGRVAKTRALWAEQMPGELYHRFMDAGFRRSGKLIYQPICAGCRACLPIRVPVASFRPSKAQRRCARRNADLVIHRAAPEATGEKFDLYRRYIARWHGGDVEDQAGFEGFLYDSPVETVEFTYRDAAGKLLAVGICDLCSQSLSSVYFYFDPAEADRGLGTFGALHEIQIAGKQDIPYYYLGYWVGGCRSMDYKKSFRPHEVLHPDNLWRAE